MDMEFSGFGEEAKRNDGGLVGVVLLALLLCGVFFLSLGAYGAFAEEGGFTDGELPGAVLALRNLVEENDSVAVFLGLSQGEADAEAAEREARILAAAEAYIKERQE
ncbi:MAG: hypothetical protein IJ009_03045 [Clostridia bacterium]|nr:hypothetical protein [Clostridia bacterium]